jgi:imidazolonepropionase-like amidohydrolase
MADLVVLEGNPVENLAALGKIRAVIIGGEIANWEWLINAKEG